MRSLFGIWILILVSMGLFYACNGGSGFTNPPCVRSDSQQTLILNARCGDQLRPSVSIRGIVSKSFGNTRNRDIDNVDESEDHSDTTFIIDLNSTRE
ncbi:MAG: hypothetical protein ABDH21_06980 [bacterium]